MKLVLRADDVGYSVIHNEGTFEVIDNGVCTSADVMLECPGTEDALRRLKERPWISVGWHTHFWGAPVLSSELVPTLVEEDRGRMRFRKDLAQAEDVSYDELRAEMRAQIERCIDILGRTPDTGSAGFGNSLFSRALKETSEEFNMPVNFMKTPKVKETTPFTMMHEEGGPLKPKKNEPERGVYCLTGGSSVFPLFEDRLEDILKYDPITYFTKEVELAPYGDDYLMGILHPGYIDYFMFGHGERSEIAAKFLLCRLEDVHCYCSKEMHDWILENRIELSNTRDAIYGTTSYQNHLRAAHSDLWMGK